MPYIKVYTIWRYLSTPKNKKSEEIFDEIFTFEQFYVGLTMQNTDVVLILRF